MQHVMPKARDLCSELVSVVFPTMRGERKAISGNLEEIGECSALVLAEAEIPKGTRIRVACESNELRGRVESCTHEQSLGFFVEVRLDPASHWSREWFTPQHLLELCQSWSTKSLKPKVFDLRIASGY
jgi:hypothetical protein